MTQNLFGSSGIEARLQVVQGLLPRRVEPQGAGLNRDLGSALHREQQAEYTGNGWAVTGKRIFQAALFQEGGQLAVVGFCEVVPSFSRHPEGKAGKG